MAAAGKGVVFLIAGPFAGALLRLLCGRLLECALPVVPEAHAHVLVCGVCFLRPASGAGMRRGPQLPMVAEKAGFFSVL